MKPDPNQKNKMLCFFREAYAQKALIFFLAKREIQSQYIGSFLGALWYFIHPMVLILIYWMVFGVAFKAKQVEGYPFVTWLTAGMCVWFFFADVVGNCCSIILNYTNFIKKTTVNSFFLPIVKIISSMVPHAFFVGILLVMILLNKLPMSFFFFQALYYLLCAIVLALGLGWIVAALNPFFRDVRQVVDVVLQVGFWLTPIMWDINMMPKKWYPFFEYNPVFYIVQGYRESFLDLVPFWAHPEKIALFWFMALLSLLIGVVLFGKLKPHFPEVL